MRRLDNATILSLWERGARWHWLDQGLLALSAALPDVTHKELADWPLGRRNRALAELHCRCFGPCLQGWLVCAKCSEKLEVQVDCRSFVGAELPDAGKDCVSAKGYSFRLPTSRDVARAALEPDPRLAAMRILDGCRLQPGPDLAWSDEEVEVIGEQLAQADPLAETRLSFICPSCGESREEALDIATFLWAEIEGRAKRLLLEIHLIASAYGWSERDILSLSESRRATYVHMVQE
jgi:hypothetical protein